MYDESAAGRVKDAADIAAVIGRHVTLARSGSGLKGLCPFHKEKTPSFHVSPQRQAFHCFGCGAGGDVFTFLMNYMGISFRDALEELAAEYGIDVSRDAPADPGGNLRRMIAEAHSFFVDCLGRESASPVRSYLEERGISQSTVKSLGVGWAPPGGVLTRHLSGLGYSGSTIIEAGLASTSGSGSTYDRFRERILFPIRDRRGRTVSFGGRTISGTEPKYLNGPDTPVYHKGDLLYGFTEARSAARDVETVILVEGYFDHARLYQSGLQCVVATCGTAITQAQARQLAALAPGVIICYDGDAAGCKAALKACGILLAEGCYPGVVKLEEGLDPDDFVAQRGIDAFIGKVETASDPVTFAASLAGGWKRIEASGKSVIAVKRLLSLAGSASGPILRETLLRRISEMTGYSMEALEGQLGSEPVAVPPRIALVASNTGRTDNALLKALLSGGDGGLDRDLLAFLEPGDFESEAARGLFSALKDAATTGDPRPRVSDLAPELVSLFTSIAVAADENPLEESDRERVRARVARKRTANRLAILRAQLLEAGEEEGKAILREMSDLGSGSSRNGGRDA